MIPSSPPPPDERFARRVVLVRAILTVLDDPKLTHSQLAALIVELFALRGDPHPPFEAIATALGIDRTTFAHDRAKIKMRLIAAALALDPEL